MIIGRAARGVRGASVFEYALVLVGVIAIGLVGMTAVGGSGRDVAQWEGGCVKALDCRQSRGAGSGGSIAPETADGSSAMAGDAWRGVRAELGTAASETVDAALEPGDVVRGIGFIASHPGAGFRALLGHRKSARPSAGASTTASTSENAARSGARVATTVSPAVVGRLGKIGKIMGPGATREQWAELDALADGEAFAP